MIINLYDNFNRNNTTTVVAKVRKSSRPWITKRQYKSAENRVGMISGSSLCASRHLLDLGYDGIDVYDGNRLFGFIMSK